MRENKGVVHQEQPFLYTSLSQTFMLSSLYKNALTVNQVFFLTSNCTTPGLKLKEGSVLNRWQIVGARQAVSLHNTEPGIWMDDGYILNFGSVGW